MAISEPNAPRQTPKPCPPARAEYLLALITPPERNDEFAEKLLEKYYCVCLKHGVGKANFYYWFQVVRAIAGRLNIKPKGLAMLSGIVAVLAALLRRLW